MENNRIVNMDEISESSYINEVGEQLVKVTGLESFTAKSGTEGHNVTVENKAGQESSFGLFLTDKSLWRYKAFLTALGFTKEDLKAVNLNVDVMRNLILGKFFIGVFETSSYDKVDAMGNKETKETVKLVDFKAR